uniref:Uncharacterized protein n=1 Tax=Timema genevievae TaxID=629358 RepID=A0A7R9JPG9_TIMGE|nr:unnamed protein product [Timema genevievae]
MSSVLASSLPKFYRHNAGFTFLRTVALLTPYSTAGHSIPHNYPFIVYLSTKHAITALTTGLRREITDLGSHIKVTSLSPGTVKTEIMYRDNTTTVNADQVYSKHPYLVSEDVADALVYVLSTPPHVQILAQESELTDLFRSSE